MKRNKQGAPEPADWSAASFRIRTADGWLEVDGIVRSPFGIDLRVVHEAGSMSWFVTRLPSGLAVVSQVKARAVVLALVDRITALADWTARDIIAPPDLRRFGKRSPRHAPTLWRTGRQRALVCAIRRRKARLRRRPRFSGYPADHPEPPTQRGVTPPIG
jgi:hypothetical protein